MKCKHFDLGIHSFPVTTRSPDAQTWFDLGLNWCYGFNHEEGLKCFENALEYDPGCAMAHWGIAYASGPFYNMPWSDFGQEEIATCTKLCNHSVQAARKLQGTITALEIDLIDALGCRFQKDYGVPQDEFDHWDNDYADAMRMAYQDYPDNVDVMALFVEALMTRTPWKLWDVKLNQPAEGADTEEALEVLERAIALGKSRGNPQHPAVLHLHIHCLEMSPTPELALPSADTLGALCPDAGHLNHMPGHIYVLCGRYQDAKIASEKAIRADRMYLEYAGPFNFYTTARCHDLHLMMYTCMFLGQYLPAMAAADELCETLTREVLEVDGRPQLAVTLEGYYSMRMHVLIRFGKWRDIVDAPMPPCPTLYCVSSAMHHYAKGVAYAALKDFTAAEQHQRDLRSAMSKIPPNRKFFNNTASDILGIGEEMLAGELEYHKGNFKQGFSHLREAVRRDDDLAYSEPWAWMHPPRHALGALLLEQREFAEAEQVYRMDLGLNQRLQRCAQHPDNIWALHGLAECLDQRSANVELAGVAEKLAGLMAQSDVAITSSCCCRGKI